MASENSSLVSTEWLATRLNDADLVVLDGSFKLPGAIPTAREDYETRHIPGAQFFDIDAVADTASSLPHMLPDPETFAQHAEAFGISNTTQVVVYDTPGLMSAGRVWWTFRVFGHDRIAVLDGGLKKWLAEQRPVTGEKTPPRQKGTFTPTFHGHMVRSRQEVLETLSSRAEQVIDARSRARFSAQEKEARPGLRSGHMPGSLNLPFNELTDPETGEMLPPARLKSLFEANGLDFGKPVVTTCGSGVTAAALLFGLHVAGKNDVTLYDGSWTEWGQPGDTPVEP